jgi:hypothetical protein
MSTSSVLQLDYSLVFMPKASLPYASHDYDSSSNGCTGRLIKPYSIFEIPISRKIGL